MLKKISYSLFLVVIGSLSLFSGSIANGQMESPHAGPVMNYHRVDDRLVTGGHLLDDGTATLSGQGVKVVIDLRDNSPSGEEERFAEQGIEWINIPVEWNDPKQADFDRFVEVMREHENDHVFVQCQANYRASAMTYLYRVVAEKVPEDTAKQDLDAVWDPNENDTWSKYIDTVKAAGHK